jgi:hypothetical protein
VAIPAILGTRPDQRDVLLNMNNQMPLQGAASESASPAISGKRSTNDNHHSYWYSSL